MHCNKLGEQINQRLIIDMICIYFNQSVTHYSQKKNYNKQYLDFISNSIRQQKNLFNDSNSLN